MINNRLPIKSNIPKMVEKIENPARFSKQDQASLKKSANEFEALFFEIMLKSMRDSVQKAKLVDGGNGEDIFRGMLDSEYARTMADKRLTGIAQAIEKQLLGPSGQKENVFSKKMAIEKYRK